MFCQICNQTDMLPMFLAYSILPKDLVDVTIRYLLKQSQLDYKSARTTIGYQESMITSKKAPKQNYPTPLYLLHQSQLDYKPARKTIGYRESMITSKKAPKRNYPTPSTGTTGACKLY